MKKTALVMVMLTALICVFFVGCKSTEDGKVSDTNTSSNTSTTSTTNRTNGTTNNNTTNNNNNMGIIVPYTGCL